jgi:hypothetical protein
MREVDFSNVEVGQRVFSILHGWGEVIEINVTLASEKLKLIRVKFNPYRALFHCDGRELHNESIYPILYYDWVWINGPKSAFTKPETHKTGNRYKYIGNILDRNSTYILSGYSGDIHYKTDVAFLVNERTGFLVNHPKRVKNLNKISMEEWMVITSEEPEKYEKIGG